MPEEEGEVEISTGTPVGDVIDAVLRLKEAHDLLPVTAEDARAAIDLAVRVTMRHLGDTILVEGLKDGHEVNAEDKLDERWSTLFEAMGWGP